MKCTFIIRVISIGYIGGRMCIGGGVCIGESVYSVYRGESMHRGKNVYSVYRGESVYSVYSVYGRNLTTPSILLVPRLRDEKKDELRQKKYK